MLRWLDRLNDFLAGRCGESVLLAKPFSIVAAIGFPLCLWAYYHTERVWLNSTGAILSFLMLAISLKIKLPFLKQKFLPLYWTIFLIYLFPFDFSYGILTNPDNVAYGMGQMLSIVILMVTITDLLLFLIISFIGTLGAALATGFNFDVLVQHANLSEVGVLYFLGVTFSYAVMKQKEKNSRSAAQMHEEQAVMKERNQTMRVLTASIAHELRTPFATIEGVAQTLKQNMSKLLKQSKNTKPRKSGDEQLSEAMIAYLEKKDLGGSLSSVVKRAHTFVDMMQQKVNYGSLEDKENQEIFSVLEQVQFALNAYAMESEELNRVRVDLSQRFQATGTPLLLQHVILNLLKNALFYTHSDPNAQIDIWLEQGDVINKLHFKDTGRGIKPEDLPYIFDAFFSKTIHGTGVGLAFCKMVMERNFNGSISCDSVLGEYTHFVIELPQVKDGDNIEKNVQRR